MCLPARTATGFTQAPRVERTLTVDLVAPEAPSYTAPSSLKVGEAIAEMTPSGGSDIDSYRATGLPSGLTLDPGTGDISGTPDATDADPASATVAVTDVAGNPADASITFPEVAKGEQPLTGFAYSSDTVMFGDAAPTLTAHTGAQGTLSYAATPAEVCTVNPSTGALALVGTGTCTITATAEGTDNYNEGTATATVTVQSAGTLALNLDAIAGDNTINIAEKADGFTISGDTGSEAGVSVQLVMDGRASGGGVTTVVVPSPSATSGTSTRAIWSYRVASGELDQSLNEPSVRVVVQATKTGFTSRLVTRTVTVDLTAPTAPTYTAPATLTVGVAITDMDPSGGIDIASYSATDLPPGLSINSTTGVISGTPDTAATTATITVTVTDTAENPATVSIPFPEVAKAKQPLTDFAYSPATVTFGDDAPTFAAPTGAQGTLSYAAAPAEVCTVNATSGALTLDGLGDCVVTATAESTANYEASTVDFTVTVEPAGMETVSVAAASATEGEAVEFTVTLSGAVGSDVELAWSTADGTATTAGDDYTAVTSGTLTIATGDTTGTLTVSTEEDLLAEADETFTVTMTGTTLPSGVTLGTATATGTIEDDDPIVASVAADAATATEGGAAMFTVTLSGATSTAAVVVTYSVTGTASSGTDYTSPSGSLTDPGDAGRSRSRP